MISVTDESPVLGFHGLCSCLRWDLNLVLVKGSRASTKRGAGLPNLLLWSRKSLGSGRFKSSERLCEPSRYLCVPRSRSGSPAFLASRRTVSCLPERTTGWVGGVYGDGCFLPPALSGVTLYLLVSETFPHSKTCCSLCLTPGRLVFDHWNFVLKRFRFVSSQVGCSWRVQRSPLTCELMNHQPPESLFVVCCSLANHYFGSKFQDDCCVKPEKAILKGIVGDRRSLSAFTRGSSITSGDNFCKSAKIL